MSCNTLTNIERHFLNLGLMQPGGTVETENRKAFEKEMKRLQGIATRTYGVASSLVKLEESTEYVATTNRTMTNLVAKFNASAFRQMDEKVREMSLDYKSTPKSKASTKDIRNDLDHIFLGDIYDSKEDMDQAKANLNEISAFMPAMRVNDTNYASVVAYKEKVLKNVNRRISKLSNDKKYGSSDELRKEKASLETVARNLTDDINGLKNDPLIFDKTIAIFDKDLRFLESIFNNGTPSIENIHLAETMIAYFESIADYSSKNKYNTFVDVSDYNAIDQDVREALDKLGNRVKKPRTDLQTAKKDYLLKAIDKSATLKALFPNQQLEEIREAMLKDISDIDLVSLAFGTVEESFFTGQETLLASLIRSTLDRQRDKQKSFASGLTQKLNFAQDAARPVMARLGYALGVKGISEINYEPFYQETNRGNKTGRLIGKFSHRWYSELASFINKTKQSIDRAYLNNDVEEMNKALASKFNWLNSRANFIDIRKIPEVINNPAFDMFQSHFLPSEADTYKQTLIDKIGQHEYDKVINKQTDLINDFINLVHEELDATMKRYNVTQINQLPKDAIHNFNIYTKRRSPMAFIESLEKGALGTVSYSKTNASGAKEYHSFINYNSYIPKSHTESTSATGVSQKQESGFYDKKFAHIEQSQELLDLWEVFHDISTYLNESLSDAYSPLNHSSLMSMTKSFTDILLDKNLGPMAKVTHLQREGGQALRDLVTASTVKMDVEDITDVNKAKIKTVQEEIDKRFEILKMKLSTSTKMDIKAGTELNLPTLDPQTRSIVEEITGTTVSKLAGIFSNNLKVSTLKEYLANGVMQEQTMNLPLMMRAYLELVSEHRAQKDALPEITVLKSLYDGIDRKTNRTRKDNMYNRVSLSIDRWVRGSENDRKFAKLRMTTWVDRQVKGIKEQHTFGSTDIHLYTRDEAEYRKAGLDYLHSLEERLDQATTDEARNSLSLQIEETKSDLDNLGKVIAVAAIYDSVINKLGIFLGLGWNAGAGVVNRFNGWYQGMINDTGRYWTEGNFYKTNAFVNRKGLRYLPGAYTYRNEIKKTRLMVEKLNTLQDATNELDRAKRASGVRGQTKKLNPFYLTEYVEWHNQVPQILAILMDKTLTSKDGKQTLPVFNGRSFEAFRVQDGQLVLKDEFDTPENRANWIDFSSPSATDNKSQISQTISMLNGDYSKTGSVFIKNNLFGKTLMMFKTWLPKQILMRFGVNQTDMALGLKHYDGAYIGGLKSKKTDIAASAGIGGIVAAGSFMALGPAMGLMIGTGLAGYAMYRSANKLIGTEDGESLGTMNQLAIAGQMLLRKSFSLPINTVAGSTVIGSQDLRSAGLTDEETHNLNFIINELTMLLYMTLFKVMMKSISGGSKDDEPKMALPDMVNPYYYTGGKGEQAMWNVIENTISKCISDVTLYVSPGDLYKATSNPAGTDSWFKRVQDMTTGLGKLIAYGTDTAITGQNQGESKSAVTLEKMFLPMIMQEWLEGDFTSFSFSNQKQKDLNPAEPIDLLMKSDYAKDKVYLKAIRAQRKKEIVKDLQDAYDYDQLDDASDKIFVQDMIDKMASRQLDMELPLSIRMEYDENQKLIHP